MTNRFTAEAKLHSTALLFTGTILSRSAWSLAVAIAIALCGTYSIALAAEKETAPATKPASTDKDGFRPLFNGKNLDGWYTFLQEHGKGNDPDKVVSIEDGAIHLYRDAKDGDKVVMGYISTEKEYGDYDLRLQYKWGTKKFAPRYNLKRDGGLYYHITGADKVWPCSLQFQIQQTDVGDLLMLYGMQGETSIDPATAKEEMPTFRATSEGGMVRTMGDKTRGLFYQAREKMSEVDGWNTLELSVRGGRAEHRVNGKLVNACENVRLIDEKDLEKTTPITKGRIALEIEAAELFYRNVEIREPSKTLPANAATAPAR